MRRQDVNRTAHTTHSACVAGSAPLVAQALPAAATLRSAWGALSAWTATLLFMFMPIAQLWACFTAPEALAGAGEIYLLLYGGGCYRHCRGASMVANEKGGGMSGVSRWLEKTKSIEPEANIGRSAALSTYTSALIGWPNSRVSLRLSTPMKCG